MANVPLGEKESETLEFKGREALRQPESVGREVVAMLNASGGTIWVGLGEEAGRAVCVEPIVDVERARVALRDHLIATIEPPLDGATVEITPVPADGGEILELRVHADQGRKPYAQLRGGARYYNLRVGDRLRPMSQEEIYEAFVGRRGTSGGRRQRVRRALAEARDQILKTEKSLFWVTLAPEQTLQIDIQRPEVRSALMNAEETGNRPNGWNFANPYVEPKLLGATIELAVAEHSIRVEEGGTIVWRMPLEKLHWKGPEKTLWPWSVLEYPVSVFRLADRLYPREHQGVVLVEMVLTGVQGWRLGPFSPRDFRYDMRLHHANLVAHYEREEVTLDQPLEVTIKDLHENPDRCAFKLVRQLYAQFGLREEEIPSEFDRASSRLILSS